MKLLPSLVLAALLLAGCAGTGDKHYSTVLAGMSRNNLRFYFGEPLRIDTRPDGSEDWYYHFSTWQSEPRAETVKNDDFGEKNTTSSIGLSFHKDVEDKPVHVGADGFVTDPVPPGKVVKE